MVHRALAREEATADDDAVALLVSLVDGDARAALTTLEVALALAPGRPVTVADVEAARSARAIRYEEDDHYDVISAFIKSIRGSDVDAGLYWLARMLAAGEDARFVARRLVILASEDIGMADPTALLIADAAARAVEFVGLPEAQLNLAQAVVHLASAPKSNGVARGHLGGGRPTWPTCPPARCRPTSATPAIGPRPGSGTGGATSTPTTTSGAGWTSPTGPTPGRSGLLPPLRPRRGAGPRSPGGSVIASVRPASRLRGP